MHECVLMIEFRPDLGAQEERSMRWDPAPRAADATARISGHG